MNYYKIQNLSIVKIFKYTVNLTNIFETKFAIVLTFVYRQQITEKLQKSFNNINLRI